MKNCVALWLPFLILSLSGTAIAVDTVIAVSHAEVPNPRQPQIAVDQRGTIYLAFGAAEDIFVCKSSDGGASYERPVKVGSLPKLALGMRRGPRIAASGETVVITAISHESGELSAWHSTDAGSTWSQPVVVNDSPQSAREGLHAMAMAPDGGLYCVWLDLRNGATQIYGAASHDGAESWSENCQIYVSPSGTVCECCHPSVAFDELGRIHVMWRNVVDGQRDMYVAASSDRGGSFGKAVRLGSASWTLDACPMDGGHLAVLHGKISTVWRREQKIFTASSDPRSERDLGRGEQPWMAATPNAHYIVWTSRRAGDLWLTTSLRDTPVKLSSVAGDPVIAAPLAGPGPVVAAWEAGVKPDTTIVTAVVAN